MLAKKGNRLTVAGLFAGVGGIELGLHRAGHRATLLCELDPGAGRVLQTRFPDVSLTKDVRDLETLGPVDLLTAGFPCQDLSQAGRTAGITGRNSGLVGHVFRLLDAVKRRSPKWLLLENVSFMLHLDRGKAMRLLIDELESRGYSWSYRVVDTRAFGLPQRRHRVLLLASRTEDPRGVLLEQDAGEDCRDVSRHAWCGFYWTEGTRGLGWAEDALPTLKGGSTIGIPSPPAIWNPRDGLIMTPEIRDAERLQGFDADWTRPALDVDGVKRGHRWKLVGNAVSVPVATWIGERLASPVGFKVREVASLPRGVAWPRAAWGHKGRVFASPVSMWPLQARRDHLADFMKFPTALLSERAASGFLSRARQSTLTFRSGFLDAVASHVERMRRSAVA
ncbi:MAG TPA: DNA (cytosine-5-)-methyltransferase [Vicinamibacterales bacterium]|nr:DNA (cytosine-5-)-methyltransferase [Vicinamibacterales bacterium]